MSLTVFLALCILGLDFMIYVLFKLTYGDRRSVVARRVAAHRAAVRAESAGLFVVRAGKTAPDGQEPGHSASLRVASTDSRKLFPHNSYHTRIA
jgi:hypothetical protein